MSLLQLADQKTARTEEELNLGVDPNIMRMLNIFVAIKTKLGIQCTRESCVLTLYDGTPLSNSTCSALTRGQFKNSSFPVTANRIRRAITSIVCYI